MIATLPQTSSDKLESRERFNEMKLAVFFKMHNTTEENQLKMLALSTNELLDMAVDAEKFKLLMDPFDPFRDRFVREQDNFFKLAELLEIREKYVHKLVS